MGKIDYNSLDEYDYEYDGLVYRGYTDADGNFAVTGYYDESGSLIRGHYDDSGAFVYDESELEEPVEEVAEEIEEVVEEIEEVTEEVAEKPVPAKKTATQKSRGKKSAQVASEQGTVGGKESKQKKSKAELKKEKEESKKATRETKKASKEANKKDATSKPSKKPKKEPKEKKPLTKGKIITRVVVGVAVIGLIVGAAVYNKTKDTNNYYTVWEKIIGQDLGYFKYTIDVQSDKTGGSIKLGDTGLGGINNSADDFHAGDLESGSSDSVSESGETTGDTTSEQSGSDVAITGETKKTDDGSKFSEWTTSDGVEELSMKYKNWTLVIEGCTMDTQNLQTVFNVKLATKNHSDRLTTITINDGYMYFDIEQFQKWLRDSKDGFLVNIANSIPVNNKYVKIKLNEFKLYSGFCEEDENDGYCNNPLDFWHSISCVCKGFLNAMSSNLGSKGLSKESDVYKLNLMDGKNSEAVLSFIKGLMGSRASFYDAVGTARQNMGSLDKAQSQQYLNEKDNFLKATEKLLTQVSGLSVKDSGLKLGGSARRYTGANGIQNLEATLSSVFTYDNVDYRVSISGVRQGKKANITTPDGSIADVSQDKLWEVCGDLIDYLNPSSIELRRHMALTPEDVSEEILDKFIEYVNSNYDDIEVSSVTVRDFIQKYKNYEVTDATTDKDKKNATLVQQFYNTFSENFSGMKVVDVESDKAVNDQFAKVEGQLQTGVTFTGEYDKSLSREDLIVIKGKIKNVMSQSIQVNLSSFAMQTESGGMYQVNTDDSLKQSSVALDLSKVEKLIDIESDAERDVLLYCVATGGLEKMDLLYNGTKLGTIITRK